MKRCLLVICLSLFLFGCNGEIEHKTQEHFTEDYEEESEELEEFRELKELRGLERLAQIETEDRYYSSEDVKKIISHSSFKDLDGAKKRIVLKKLIERKKCKIKGNISTRSREKIYHMPYQQHYDQTIISEHKGEKYFCTEDEAIEAGWRKSKR